MRKALVALMIALALAVVCNPISAKGTDPRDAQLNIRNCVLNHEDVRHLIVCSYNNQNLQCLLWRSNGGFILRENERTEQVGWTKLQKHNKPDRYSENKNIIDIYLMSCL